MLRDLDAVLARGRAMAEQRMRSRGTIRRRSGAGTVVDGARVYSWPVVATDVPIRVGRSASGTTTSSADTIAGGRTQVGHYVASLPIGTPVAKGDFIDVTAGESAPRVVRVVSVELTDDATALRVPIVDEPRPEEWTP